MNKDKLTGLLLFDDFIIEATRCIEQTPQENMLVVISCDISNFKYINRMYGYEAGDKLIAGLAKCMVHEQENCICACRPYSDHILGIFEVCFEWEEARTRLRKVQEQFVKLYKKDVPRASLHLNVGVYVFGDHREPITSAIDKSNIARRSVKGNYCVSCAVYTKEMQEKKEEDAKIIPIFEKALEEKKILVYLQPKVSVSGKRIVGAEALTRLVDDDGKIISPDVFIPILENSGKVLDLDWYVMSYVFGCIQRWLSEGKTPNPISINLSKIHFYYDNLVNDIIKEFDLYSIPAKYVEFEITESVFFEEAELIISKIGKLREHGFKVSVDDFGAGYSSLNLIGILPVDTIKLDKGFIKNGLNNKKGKDIIKGLIQILNEIDMDIVCEGIETPEEEKIVFEFGCDSMQGFLYDKPIPIQTFEAKYLS